MDTPLKEVNGLEFNETNYKSGEILSDGVKKAEVGFSVWSLSSKDGIPTNDNIPVIGEFDIDVDVKD